VRDTVLVPLDSDEGSHRYLPIASFAQKATLHLRDITFHRQLSVLLPQSRQLRTFILAQHAPSDPPRRLSALAQLPSGPSLMPRSRATCATGLPVSRTSPTAPSRKSASNPLRVSAVAVSFKAISQRYEGKPTLPGACGLAGAVHMEHQPTLDEL
jgi:hypothetical protein